MTKDTTVVLREVSTGYPDRKNKFKIITSGLNATLRSRELTCLLGPNGAGKSTLLRTLAGFLAPVSGNIEINGRPIASFTSEELARRISVVLTERLAVPNMSVAQMVGLGRSPYTDFWGRLRDADIEAVKEAMSLTGIEHLSERTVGTLSDGERQKVMIAKALAQETPVIFLDEPTAFLDYPSKVEMMNLLHRLSRIKNKTIFMSTHDLDLALQITDKVWLIDRKKGVATGNPEDLSLSGILPEYFAGEGIGFDSAKGVFVIEPEISRYAPVSGSGVRFEMLVKALRRNGIGATAPSHDSAGVIAVTDKGCYTFEGIEYHSIEQLLDVLI